MEKNRSESVNSIQASPHGKYTNQSLVSRQRRQRRFQSSLKIRASAYPRDRPPEFHPMIHPDLPVNATVNNYFIDYEQAKNSNLEDRFKPTTISIFDMSEERRRRVAAARLMEGKYEITASNPCDHCVSQGITCPGSPSIDVH